MLQALKELIDEAILMEKNVANLYLMFHEMLEEDSNFWWTLAMEEENHAALLRTAKEMMNMESIEFPEDLLPESLEALKASNKMVLDVMEDFRLAPSRSRALQMAQKIENSAGELHYDQFMHQTPDSRIRKVFMKLNGDDKDHASRIAEYMRTHHIPSGE